MKKVKAFATTSGKLFTNRDDFVKAELIELLGKDADGKPTGIEAAIDGMLAYRGAIVDLLHVPKTRGPHKPKAVNTKPTP